ncbi:MAG: HPr(Ser) kinase/phosphatase, partial [Elusimicrobiota bacterium]|nr:HPr(Ser) kinase/phosphatase [Elusimicrobiota bacterium]
MNIKKLTVEQLLKDLREYLKLNLISGKEGILREIKLQQINRLGLSLAGHFTYFPSECIQICGLTEHSYLQTLSSENRYNIIKQLFSSFPQIPCLIITTNINPITELVDLAQEFSLPLIKTSFETAKFITELNVYLEEQLAPSITVHGVLVDVYGLGVLILGESGIGKSECALELLKRGHMLIADDVIQIKLKSGGVLSATGAELIRHHMEVRGLGIIDIKQIFGIGSILDKTRLELVIKLEEWKVDFEYDRLGMEERTTNILGITLPEVVIPVRLGRNLAVLIEVAALNHRLKQKG